MFVRAGTSIPLLVKSTTNGTCGNRYFWRYLIGAFNMYDSARVKEVGPDRAAAEWLLKNGASVRWQGHAETIRDYNVIGVSGGRYIEVIDCTGSSVSNAGFRHMKGLQHVREVKLINCWDVGDGAMRYIAESIPETLERLDVISCGVSEEGLFAMRACKALKQFRVGNLPNIEDMQKVVEKLKSEFAKCQVEHVKQIDDSHKRKKRFLSGLFG